MVKEYEHAIQVIKESLELNNQPVEGIYENIIKYLKDNEEHFLDCSYQIDLTDLNQLNLF